MKGFIVAGVALLVVSCTAHGQEMRYVNDQLVINFRSGAGGEYRILATLGSGRSMTLLKEDGDFSHVRLENGKEGWVRRQYLSKQPVARALLVTVNKRLKTLKREQATATSELKRLRAENEDLNVRLNKLEKERDNIVKENSSLQSLAARPMEIDQQNKQLIEKNATLVESLERLQEESEGLRNSTVQKWFMAGGTVLFAGIVLGFVLPKMGRRKASSW